jgi:RNA polymerase sigma-70 factor (ECF subfamily)
MRPLTPQDDLDPRTSALISYKAKKLARTPGFARHEEEDIQQELALHVIERMRRFDPTRASAHTYADRVLASKVTDMVRRTQAQRRDHRRAQSLDALPPRTAVELTEKTFEATHHAELRHDVPIILAQLSATDRTVALSLAHQNVAEITRRTSLSRQQVRTARQRIRLQFEDCEVAA